MKGVADSTEEVDIIIGVEVVVPLEVNTITIEAEVPFSALKVPHHSTINVHKIREVDIVMIIKVRVTMILWKKSTCNVKMICQCYHNLNIIEISVMIIEIIMIKVMVIITLGIIDVGETRLQKQCFLTPHQ